MHSIRQILYREPKAFSRNIKVLKITNWIWGFSVWGRMLNFWTNFSNVFLYSTSLQIKVDFELYDWVLWFRSQRIRLEKARFSPNEPRGEYFIKQRDEIRGRMFVLQEKLLASPLMQFSQPTQLKLTSDKNSSIHIVRREQMSWCWWVDSG